MLPLMYRPLRILTHLSFPMLALLLPAQSLAHVSDAAMAQHAAEHVSDALWLLPILLIGVAGLLLRRNG